MGRVTRWLGIASGFARDNYNVCIYIYECAYNVQSRAKVIKATRRRLLYIHFKLCDASGDCAICIENAGGRIICPKRIRLMCARHIYIILQCFPHRTSYMQQCSSKPHCEPYNNGNARFSGILENCLNSYMSTHTHKYIHNIIYTRWYV